MTKLGLKIYGGIYIALLVILLVVCLTIGLNILSSADNQITAQDLAKAAALAFGASISNVIGALFVMFAIPVFCVLALLVPLYVLDAKSNDTRIFNIVLLSLFVAAVIVLSSIGAARDSFSLLILTLPAAPMLLYNVFSLINGVNLAKKKALLKPNEGEIVEEEIQIEGNTDDLTQTE